MHVVLLHWLGIIIMKSLKFVCQVHFFLQGNMKKLHILHLKVHNCEKFINTHTHIHICIYIYNEVDIC